MLRAAIGVVLLLCVVLPAQERVQALPAGVDGILAVEKREDRPGRDRIAALLRRTRLQFAVNEIGPKDLCRYLATLTGDKVAFRYLDKGSTAPVEPVTLELHATNLLSAMSAVQTVTGLRFVYRDGVVFLVPKDQFKPLTWLEVIDLRGVTRPLPSFPGPRIGLLGAGEEAAVLFPPEGVSGSTISGFTAEGLEQLIRENVTPEAWGEKATLTNHDGLFLVRHDDAGHRAVRVLLHELGVLELPLPAPRPRPPARTAPPGR